MGSAPTSEACPQWRTVRAAFPHTVATAGSSQIADRGIWCRGPVGLTRLALAVFHAPALATKGCRIARRLDVALVELDRNLVVARGTGSHDLSIMGRTLAANGLAFAFTAATPVRSLCSRMVCTRRGMIGADVRPDWGPHVNKRHV